MRHVLRGAIPGLAFLLFFSAEAKLTRAKLYNEPGCHTVHIFSLQNYRSHLSFSAPGHSGIGIDNEFFDFGFYEEGFWGSLIGKPGGPYLDRKLSAKGNLSTEEAYRLLSTFHPEHYKVHVLAFAVDDTQAANLLAYWRNLYQDKKYRYFGLQCTSSIYRSLVASKLLSSVDYGGPTQLPKIFYTMAKRNLRFTCGRYQGYAPLEINLP